MEKEKKRITRALVLIPWNRTKKMQGIEEVE